MALIWGTAFAFQSMAMDYLEPFTFNGIRTLLGAVVLIPLIIYTDRQRKKLGVHPKNTDNRIFIAGGIICGIFLFAASSMQQIGINETSSAGKAGFLTALYIVMVPILGIFLKKRVEPKIWISVVIAVIGTYFLSVKEGFSMEIGDIYIIIGAFLFSIHILFIDKYSSITDAIKLSFMQFLTAGTISMIAAFILETPRMDAVMQAWLPILYAGVMSSGVAYTIQIIGQRDTSPAVASLIMSLESVFAALAGWVILNERLSPKELFGCTMVFAAVIIAQIPVGKLKKGKSLGNKEIL